ncbi:SCO family protein [Salinimicrobium xinjiangense]|uniref:SCO family protein n=1 Tax=Salinimicrobium xinjiangense TaxID=438596 RepID=UPI00048E3AE3|nr:SCO family protein [Salinimicrobium xinjiangense]
MKKIILILVVSVFAACNQTQKEEVAIEQEVALNETPEVKRELPELSIYNLPSTWTTQDNEHIQLEDLHGKVLVMVMIYTSCKAACPRLIADMRNIERQVPAEDLDKTRFIMVSIDPETDTPQRLHSFAKENEMEDDHWMFLRGTPEDTREFAAVLAVSYKKISPIDFSHSNIISVFDEEGVLVHQQEGLGVDNTETVEAIKAEVSN